MRVLQVARDFDLQLESIQEEEFVTKTNQVGHSNIVEEPVDELVEEPVDEPAD